MPERAHDIPSPHGYEFSVAFSAADMEEADQIIEAVLLAVCGGKSWRHRRPWRWLLGRFSGVVCPRFFIGSGPYELDEDGESKYDAGKRYFQRPALFPSVWNTNNGVTTTWTLTGEPDGTA